MRQLRRVMFQILCVIAMLAASVTAVATGAQASVPNRWGFAVVNVTSGIPDPNHQAGSWGRASTSASLPAGSGRRS